MPERDDVDAHLDDVQLSRLRRARWRWGLCSLVGGVVFLAVVAAFSSSHQLPPGSVFGVLWLICLSVIVPWTQLSKDPTKGSTSARRLVISADPARIKRVSIALRRGQPLDHDDEVIARARVGVAGEQIQICALVMGLSVVLVLVVSIRARLTGGAFPWAVVASMAVVVAGMVWRIIGLARLMVSARERGILDRGLGS